MLANDVLIQVTGMTSFISYYVVADVCLAEGLPFGGVGPSGCTSATSLAFMLVDNLKQPVNTRASMGSICSRTCAPHWITRAGTNPESHLFGRPRS